jgi:hypothetical protein
MHLVRKTMRVHFIELHEQTWFPSTVRDEITDAMQFGLRVLRVYVPVLPILRSLLDSTGTRRIVDLCSGGGGPWFDLAAQLGANGGGIGVLLTDKYPNVDTTERSGSTNGKVCGNVAFYPNPVDALNIPPQLKGLRTMFSSFHHFPPDDARAILQNAVDACEGICVFEVSKRDLLTVALMFPWSLMPLLFTPWIRPFRWSRLLWTYIVPIIPLVLLFDGVVSCLRTYEPHELHEIVEKLRGVRRYEWEIGELSSRVVFTRICYLTGFPERECS